MAKVTAQYLYSGLPDYWSGDGDRWDDNKGCVFASYGPTTTLHELVDEFVSDYNAGGDTDGKAAFEDVSGEDVRAAILESFTDKGREDYENDAISEFAMQLDAEDYPEDDYDGDYPYVVMLLTVEQD